MAKMAAYIVVKPGGTSILLRARPSDSLANQPVLVVVGGAARGDRLDAAVRMAALGRAPGLYRASAVQGRAGRYTVVMGRRPISASEEIAKLTGVLSAPPPARLTLAQSRKWRIARMHARSMADALRRYALTAQPLPPEAGNLRGTDAAGAKVAPRDGEVKDASILLWAGRSEAGGGPVKVGWTNDWVRAKDWLNSQRRGPLSTSVKAWAVSADGALRLDLLGVL